MSGTLAVAAVVMATYVPYAEAFIVSGTAALARLQARPLRASGSARATSMCESGGSQQALHGAMSRRQLLLGAAAAGAQSTLFPLPAQAEGASGIFKDADRGFFFSPPAGWDQAEGEFPGANRNPARPKIMSWINPEAKEVNLALVSYSIRPDYSKIGSLGNMEAVARTITGAGAGEDKPLDAEMFEQIERGNSYYFDYRIKDKRLNTVFAIQEQSGSGSWLVTLTAQAPNNRLYEDNKAIFKEALDSFKLVKYGE